MKPAPATSTHALAKHLAAETGVPYQSVRDAIARREFDVLRLGREDSRRPHVYLKRADFARWLEARTTPKKQTTPQLVEPSIALVRPRGGAA